jgi:hypothetical protein
MNRDLGSFLHENTKKSNNDLADDIRDVKKLSNKHDNVVIHQEKKSIAKAAQKLNKIIKVFGNAELKIKLNNKTWQQD